MNPKQLELELEYAFEDAAEMPMLADLRALWQQAEPLMAQLSIQDQLRVGGLLIEQLADLHRAKAECLLDAWENAFNPQDPTLPIDWLQGLVRQTQQVDVSELTTPVQRRPRGSSQKAPSDKDTVVGEVPKANVLKMLEQVDQASQKAAALAVAHHENIEAWVRTITIWFEQHPEPITLNQLQHQLGWSLVKLWLSLLLGDFSLESTDGQFYSNQILVSGLSVAKRTH